MGNSKEKKSTKQKKVLAASILLAVIIVIGATFAWFTSKDEVTNKLTASNNYGVSITETFTPPDNWAQGQSIDKKVGAVNTGNVDAFVRLNLTNSIDVTLLDANGSAYDSANTTSFVELSANEVTSLQAGGILVWEGDKAPDSQKKGTSYTPTAAGLYLFSRTDSKTVGYYFDGTKYYALQKITNTSGTYSAVLQTKTVVKAQDLTFDYTNISAADPYIIATYAGSNAQSKDDDIVINIYLDKNYASSWERDTTSTGAVFYYKSILAAGAQANNLVDHLVLDSSVKNEAYITFDYNLTVGLDSVQISPDDAKITAVNSEWSADAEAAVSGTAVTWSFK